MANLLDELGFKSNKTDFDIWLHPVKKPDGKEYYEYVMLYVDDVMAANHKARQVMEDLGNGILYKHAKIEPPGSYLGAQLVEKTLPSGIECWCISSDRYVNAAIRNVEEVAKKRPLTLPGQVRTPMDTKFVPELDRSQELDSPDVHWNSEMDH